MKHVNLFNDFLKDTVNLNDTRIEDLETSVSAIKDFVRGSNWIPRLGGWMEQGSWAHKTIIKPVDQGEFDADLIVFVYPVEGWTAAQYIETLYDEFRGSKTYKDMVKWWSHCVTITYANDKKIDVAPCVMNRNGYNQREVCNRTTDEFELSEPEKYTDWLTEQNSYSGNNSFRKVTRLIKYLRDIKERFTCSSVLLTTILGYRISPLDSVGAEFADTPTALRTIFGRMDDWLQMNLTKPQVINPFLLTENFADAWTDNQYTNFRDKVHTYREWIDEAFEEQDRDESIAKWRRVFGHDFASGVVLEEGKSVSKNAVALLKSTVSAAALFTGDLVEAFARFGTAAVPARIYRLPYMDRPTWRKAQQQYPVQVKADLSYARDGAVIGPVSETQVLQPGRWLHFRAVTNMGVPFNTNDFYVWWRVTNTDEAAFNDDALRGEFYKPDSDRRHDGRSWVRGVRPGRGFRCAQAR